MFSGLVYGSASAQEFVHGLSLYDKPKYESEFTHFDYVNPHAPRGGKIRQGTISNFNNFNILTFKGTAAPGLGLIYDTLTVNSSDEPFSVYGSLAEGMSISSDKKSMIFRLREGLTWHDGKPLTAHDVVWTFKNLLGENGLPQFQSYLAAIADIWAENDRDVVFSFRTDNNPELPLIIGSSFVILPKHHWDGKDLTKPTLDLPLGSGPYRIESFKQNDRITYRRVENYWQDRVGTGVGMNNFDEIEYIVFNDPSVRREAAKAGEIDIHTENVAKEWATGYDINDVKEGRLILEKVGDELPHGMQGFVFNLRRFPFQDPVFRNALAYAMDFGWLNTNLFYNQYSRTHSFFGAKGMSAEGLPGKGELELLEPLRDSIPAEVFTEIYTPPQSDGSSQQLRSNLSKALNILTDAGYTIEGGKLYPPDSDMAVQFELLLYDPSFERVALPFKSNAKRLGIVVDVQRNDPVEYSKRVENLDFDMIISGWGQSLSPGNEQAAFWGSATANKPGTPNLSGISSPAIDRLIDNIILAPTRAGLLMSVRALDRVLLHSHIVIPHWHSSGTRYVYRSFLGKPPPTLHGTSLMHWWVKP